MMVQTEEIVSTRINVTNNSRKFSECEKKLFFHRFEVWVTFLKQKKLMTELNSKTWIWVNFFFKFELWFVTSDISNKVFIRFGIGKEFILLNVGAWKLLIRDTIAGIKLLLFDLQGVKKPNTYKIWNNSYQGYLSLNATITYVKFAADTLVSQHSIEHDTLLHGPNKEKYLWYSSFNIYTIYSARIQHLYVFHVFLTPCSEQMKFTYHGERKKTWGLCFQKKVDRCDWKWRLYRVYEPDFEAHVFLKRC